MGPLDATYIQVLTTHHSSENYIFLGKIMICCRPGKLLGFSTLLPEFLAQLMRSSSQNLSARSSLMGNRQIMHRERFWESSAFNSVVIFRARTSNFTLRIVSFSSLSANHLIFILRHGVDIGAQMDHLSTCGIQGPHQ